MLKKLATPNKMPLTLATWNINSVRLRMPLIKRLCTEHKIDILCLQETKCPDDAFPHDELAALGFEYRAIWGMKSYNGVAILSRFPLADTTRHARCGTQDCRHLSASVPDVTLKDHPLVVHNVYLPAGGYEPDPIGNPKFQHKLDFIDELADWSRDNVNADTPVILCGDLNVAPLEQDVWSHKQMLKVVSHTPAEVSRFEKFWSAGEWHDVMRDHIPPAEKLYTWWSYRARDWAASDRGRRLDHIVTTPPLAPLITDITVLRDSRGWPRPSDHVPVISCFG